jgi:PAS domain S-box-containing protein
MNLIELHPQESRQEASVLLQEMLKKERKFCPIPFISKSGEIYSVESRVWTGKWNKEDCIYAVSKDLTKENEDFQVFSKIFENNALPMAIKDIEKNEFINVNPALFKMLGYKEKLVIENKTDSIDLFIDSSKLKSYTNKKINGEEVKDKEIDIINIYKKELKCLLSIEDITIQGKKSFLIILIDITERDELAKSVEDKLQKLTNVIDGTSLGTWEWNILTKELQVNKHFANMLGYSKNEVGIFTSDTFNEFINPEEVELSNEILKRHLNGELDYYDIEMRMKHKDGRWIWIHNIGRVTQRDKTGMPIKMFGTYSNINVNDKMKMYN